MRGVGLRELRFEGFLLFCLGNECILFIGSEWDCMGHKSTLSRQCAPLIYLFFCFKKMHTWLHFKAIAKLIPSTVTKHYLQYVQD